MKLTKGLFLLAFGLIFIQCLQKKEEQTTPIDEITVALKPGEIPRFDSIDWRLKPQKKLFGFVPRLEKKRKVQLYFDEFWKDTNVSGGLLVAQNGKIVFEDYLGYANFETHEEMTANTSVHLASISKVLTGFAILKLVQYNLIKLDQTVSSVLPTFPFKDITIRDLLNHRSGLQFYGYFVDQPNIKWDKSKFLTNQDILDILASGRVTPVKKRDKGFMYSNTNFALLALIIEKVTNKSYKEAMDYMVFKPIGMTNTYVFDLEKDKNTATPSYRYKGGKWGVDFLDAVYGDKNIYSTPRDLYKLDQAMYNEKFLPKKLEEEAWKGYSYEEKGVKNYGLGMRMMEFPNGKKILYHNGWWHGNYTVFVHGFEEKFTIIALGNKQNKNVYGAFRLSALFGDYPLKIPSKKDTAKVDL